MTGELIVVLETGSIIRPIVDKSLSDIAFQAAKIAYSLSSEAEMVYFDEVKTVDNEKYLTTYNLNEEYVKYKSQIIAEVDNV